MWKGLGDSYCSCAWSIWGSEACGKGLVTVIVGPRIRSVWKGLGDSYCRCAWSIRGSEACGKGLVTVIVAVRGLSGDQKRVERAW